MEKISNFRNLIYFEAVLFMLLGLAAIAVPQVFTIGFELLIGSLFLVGGIVQFIRLFQTWSAPGRWGSFFSALLNVIIGALLLFFPLVGIVSLTYLMIAYFLVDGITKIYYSLQLKNYENWGWILFSGIISLILAGLIFSGLPGTAVWTLGLLIGINMLFFGFSLFGFASTLKN